MGVLMFLLFIAVVMLTSLILVLFVGFWLAFLTADTDNQVPLRVFMPPVVVATLFFGVILLIRDHLPPWIAPVSATGSWQQMIAVAFLWATAISSAVVHHEVTTYFDYTRRPPAMYSPSGVLLNHTDITPVFRAWTMLWVFVVMFIMGVIIYGGLVTINETLDQIASPETTEEVTWNFSHSSKT